MLFDFGAVKPSFLPIMSFVGNFLATLFYSRQPATNAYLFLGVDYRLAQAYKANVKWKEEMLNYLFGCDFA